MDIRTYQDFTPTTAVYPHEGAGNVQESGYLAMGLCSEAGEVAGKIKKWYRDGKYPDKQAIEDELGDVLWYISQLANCFKLDLNKILIRNRDKLIDRQNRHKLGGSGDNR
jgi:NTP pyrophosphatase (non-canonical NTP hydrolase)